MVPRCRSSRRPGLLGLLALALGILSAAAGQSNGVSAYHKQIEPLLTQYCYDCHGDGMKKGGVAFDEFTDQSLLTNRDVWWTALKYLRAGIMPPEKKPHPSDDQKQLFANWVKLQVFDIDPNNLDPGRVTLRRLNRIEYRNTIRALLGVDYDTALEFPPDDTGYGFDDIGDVLTLSPMLLEKYVTAASDIMARCADDPEFHQRFFPEPVPLPPTERRKYAHELLRSFAGKAYRCPVDDHTVNRLADLAERFYTQPGKTFEAGIAHAMEAVIASPRFLFRLEDKPSGHSKVPWSEVNEYALASRLSYFLWSTMPDEKLTDLAAHGELRKNLASELKRMLADPRSQALIENFTGQWLQVRDVANITIHAREVLARDQGKEKDLQEDLDAEANGLKPRHHIEARFHLDAETRSAMMNETEMCFATIVREDRPVTELIESDYTFLNERLAKIYGLTNLDVRGPEMRRVQLPPDSPRGGVLGEGAVLTVTSNPDRTSPVKRGLFVLNNILGTPAPPPPPNIPALEASERHLGNRPTLRATLELHRSKPMCASCHDRLDPIGLAMENFNALGIWRAQERGQPIDPSGKLITGEPFKDVRELKHILATKHRTDFFRCLTEKMLTYAIGRGLEYYDVETVDKIVQQLQQNDGRFSVLLNGVIDSAPFQKQRNQANPVFADSAEPPVKTGSATVAN